MTCLLFAVAVAGCSSNDDAEESAGPADDVTAESGAGEVTVLEGAWESPCQIEDDNGTNTAYKFEGSRFELTQILYDDNDCVTLGAGAQSPAEVGNFVLGGEVDTEAGMKATEIDFMFDPAGISEQYPEIPVLELDTLIEGNVEEGESKMYRVFAAAAYALTSVSGDADLAVYADPQEEESLFCEPESHSDSIEICNESIGSTTSYVRVTGVTAAEFTLRANAIELVDGVNDRIVKDIFLIQDGTLYFGESSSGAGRPDALDLEKGYQQPQ